MIKQINISKVRGISKNFFNLGKINYIYGYNGAGKSTIITGIIDSFKGSSTLRDGDFSIFLDDNTSMTISNGVVKGSIGLGKNMDLQVAGYFMNKEITGVNKTKEDKRKTILEILGIDREEFFKNKGVDFDIIGLRKQIKELDTISKTLTKELIYKQNELNSLEEVIKPKTVKLKEGNQKEYNLQKSILLEKEKEIQILKEELQTIKLIEPKEIILVKTEIIQGNEEEYNLLSKKLNEIKDNGKELGDKLTSLKEGICTCCKQTYSNPQEIESLSTKLESLRKEYLDLSNQIKTFNLIKTKVKKGNEEEYNSYLQELNTYKFNLDRKEKLKEELNLKTFNLGELSYNFNSMKLIKGNKEKYDEYIKQERIYNIYVSNKDILEKDIENYKIKIKENNSIELQSKLELYKKTEKEFISMLDGRAQLDSDTKFIFYRELKTPNTDGDSYTSDFDIEYKGKLYSECSMGEKAYIDILLAKMFIDYNAILDFIVIDNAELSNEKLDQIIKEQLTSYQVFATRITDGDLDIISE